MLNPIKITDTHTHTHARTHTHTHIRWDFSGRKFGPSQKHLPDNTQHSQQTNCHAPCGIRNKIPRKRAATVRASTGVSVSKHKLLYFTLFRLLFAWFSCHLVLPRLSVCVFPLYLVFVLNYYIWPISLNYFYLCLLLDFV